MDIEIQSTVEPAEGVGERLKKFSDNKKSAKKVTSEQAKQQIGELFTHLVLTLLKR
jgi:hypothetical protein